MDAPRLRIALPQSDGGLLLDFEHGERRRLDAETMSIFGLTAAGLFIDAGAMNAEGLRNQQGDRAAVSLLHAASQPETIAHERRSGLHLAQCRTTTSGGSRGAPRSIDVMFYPFERSKNLRIDDVIGAGMAADGYATEIALDVVIHDPQATRLLHDAGADWLLDVLKANAGRDHAEHARAVLRGAWSQGNQDLIVGERLPGPPVDPATLTRTSAPIEDGADADLDGDPGSRARIGQGWWAPPGGEPRWFETSNYHFIDLAADITAVALRMQENRQADGVPDASDILLLPFGSNYKLRMIWFDPRTSEALGADEYVIVLRDDGDESFDADDFEHTCRDAGQHAVEVEGYAGPQLHFRWEWGGDHWPLDVVVPPRRH
jgi:hypothetical protein